MLGWGEVATRGRILCWLEQAELSPCRWDRCQLTPAPKPTPESLCDPVLSPMTPHPFSQQRQPRVTRSILSQPHRRIQSQPGAGIAGASPVPVPTCRKAHGTSPPKEHQEQGAEWSPHLPANPRAVSARGRAWQLASISGTVQHPGRAAGRSRGWVPLQPPGAGLPPAHSPPGLRPRMRCPPKPSPSQPWPQAAPWHGAAGAVLLGLQGARQGAEPGVCWRAGGAQPPPHAPAT